MATGTLWHGKNRSGFEDTGEPIDPVLVLGELKSRWQSARTLEYRSVAVLNHAGEFRVEVRVWARLRRPNLARLLFWSDNPEVSRARVCDGLLVWEREAGTLLRPARTLRTPSRGGILRDIAHPLDETAYCADQFFSPTPFLPPPIWGGGRSALKVSAVRIRKPKQKDRFQVVFESPPARDTLTLEAISLAPISLVRVGEHAGQVQELLKETFDVVRLGPNLAPDLFRWTPDDERGEPLRAFAVESRSILSRDKQDAKQ